MSRQASETIWIVAITAPVVALLLAGSGAGAAGAASAPLQIDMTRSYIVAKAGKAGVLGFLGHKHGVLATAWEAEVSYDAGAPETSSIAVVVTAAQLVVDTEEARRRARLVTDGPSETDRPGIQSRMLEEVLDVERHATIQFRSDRVEARGDNRLRVHGQMTLAGATRPVEADVWVRAMEEFTLFSARFAIKQTDFGIDPVSIGGMVKVADEIEIRFELWTLER